MTDEYPEFRTVLRGYDPAQVEEILDEVFAALDEAVKVADGTKADLSRLKVEHDRARAALQQSLDQAQGRVAQLEQSAGGAPATFENLGTRIGAMLSAADEEASDIRRKAREEAQRVHDEVQAAALTTRAETDHHVERQRAAAEKDAAALVEHAQRAAAALRGDAERDAADVRQQTAALYAEAETSTAARRSELDRSVAERREQADAEHAARLAEHDAQLSDVHARAEAVEAHAAERVSLHAEHREQVRTRVSEMRAQIAGLLGSPADAGAVESHGESGPAPDGQNNSSPVADEESGREQAAPPPSAPPAAEPPVVGRPAAPSTTEPPTTEPQATEPQATEPQATQEQPPESGYEAAAPPSRYAFGVVPQGAQHPPVKEPADGDDESFEGEPWARDNDEPARRRWLSSKR